MQHPQSLYWSPSHHELPQHRGQFSSHSQDFDFPQGYAFAGIGHPSTNTHFEEFTVVPSSMPAKQESASPSMSSGQFFFQSKAQLMHV